MAALLLHLASTLWRRGQDVCRIQGRQCSFSGCLGKLFSGIDQRSNNEVETLLKSNLRQFSK